MGDPRGLPTILLPKYEPLVVELLRAYFGLGGYPRAYTGAHFETVGHPWHDPATIDTVTAADIVAVSCLSVDIPAAASVKMLGTDAPHLAALLRRIPADLDLWSADDDVLEPGSAAWELWDAIRAHHGLGPTTASKLIARKRPRLVPIYDEVTRLQIGLASSVGQWDRMRELMRTEVEGAALHERLASTAARAGLPPAVTPLRVFDAAVWLWANDREKATTDEAGRRARITGPQPRTA